MIMRVAVMTVLLVSPVIAELSAFAEEEAPGDTLAVLDARRVNVDRGAVIGDSSIKARSNYRAFLDLISDDPGQRADAMRRLGDLELEASEAELLAENAGAIEFEGYDNAVDLFRALLERYPDYQRNDSVLYQLARAYEVAGDTDDALRILDELVQRYPATPHIDEAQFRRGEMLFLKKDYNAAEMAYLSAVEHGESSRFYEQSLYKLGWSRFKLGWHEDSLDPFFDLLDRKIGDLPISALDDFLETLSRADRELVQDALRVLSISFSYMDGPASIAAFLDGRGNPAYGFAAFMSLGDLYLEKQRYQDAAETYGSFVARDPYHRLAPALQIEVIEAHRQGNFPTLVIESKRLFVERYGFESPFWQRNSRKENAAVAASLEENLNDLAQYYHAEAQAKQSPTDYEEAARWYRKRLEYFPGAADSAHVNFLLAEVLFENSEFRAAVEVYERTGYDLPLHDESAEAAYAAVLAYREQEWVVDKEAYEEWHRRYLESGLRFGTTYPDHPEAATVLTTISEDLFGQGRFELAIEIAQSVVGRESAVDPALARTSWTVIAHSYFEIGDYAEAERAYYSLESLTSADDVIAQSDIKERIASSIYKQGEQARDSGDLEAAVASFRRLGRDVPDSTFRETAEYDAAAALIALQSWERASIALEDFRHNYPDSQYAGAVMRNLAVVYEKAGQSMQAAGEFIRIADFPDFDDELRREALWRASELFRDSGEVAREEQILDVIVARYPDPIAESIEARFRLLEIAEQDGEASRRIQRLQELVDADGSAGDQRSDRSRFLAAKASFELAEIARREFVAVHITQPLANSLGVKKSLMQDALDAYAAAAGYDVAEITTAATFRLGEIYQQFSQDLLASERPDGLDELAMDQYELLLEEQAFPLEEKAIEFYEVNTARTADGVWDKWVKESFAALAILLPARYAKSEKSDDVVTALY